MAKEFAKAFYNSMAWYKCSRSYKKFRHGLCEDCLKKGLYTPGVIVHHVIPLDPENISDPKIALGFDNLRLVCRACHSEEHPGAFVAPKRKKRYYLGPGGQIIIPPDR